MARLLLARRILPALILGLASLLVLPSLTAAVEIVAGQVYESGTRLSASNVGITTSVPTAWRATLPAGSSYHEKTEIWLCSGGSFQRSGDAGGYGGGASEAWAESGQGRWKATGAQPAAGRLDLRFADGVASYALSLEGGKLYLDDTQWLRGEHEYCR